MSDVKGDSTAGADQRVYGFGPFRLETASRRLWLDDQPVKLTAKTFDILLFLVQRHGLVVEREELLQSVWRDSFVEDGNLTVHIAALRKLLGDSQREPRFISTVARRGYCFVAKVREVRYAEPVPIPGDVPSAGSSSELASLAVLPFRSVGNNDELGYLADGITENLINSLSKLPQLRVLSASAVSSYKDKFRDPAAVGKGLGVAAVLTGGVRSTNDQLVVAVELINVKDGVHLWGTQYRQPMADIFELQESIALAITEKLLPALTAEEKSLLENRQTKSPEAYRSYLKGRRFLSQLTTESIRKSLLLFEQAVQLDPNYALAHIRIGLSYYYLNTYYQVPYDEALKLITKAIDRAFEIDPNLSEAHTLRGIYKLIYEWNWPESEAEFRAGVDLNPNSIFARSAYANALKIFERYDETWYQLEKVAEIGDPISLSLNTIIGSLLYDERRFEEAIVHFEEMLEIYPDTLLAYEIMSLCFQQLGDYETALEKMKKAYSIEAGNDVRAFLGAAMANAGQKDEARQILMEIEKAGPPVPLEVFHLYIALDQIDDAFEFIERSLSRREVNHIGLNTDPRADRVRSDPRFISLLRRMNIPVSKPSNI